MSGPFVPQKKRDHRLDVLRGLALLTIFIDHVPGNIYEHVTIRNFGFSDAAEAFVLMSGIAVGMAYSRPFKAGEPANGVQRVWSRAGTLYVTHMVTSMIAIGIIASGLVYLGTFEIIPRVNFAKLIDDPFATFIGLPLLTHQLGYFNILPLYTVLLVASPLYLLIGLRSRLAMVGFAVAVWVVAGTFRLNFPNYPNSGGWFFDPFSWQLIYAVGIAGGLSALDGRKVVAHRPWLYWSCVGFLVFSCIWVWSRLGGWVGQEYLPFYIAGFDKAYLALPRLLHALALAYVLTNTQWVSTLLATRAFKPVETLGRNSLPVFATGSVLAIALQVLRIRYDTSILTDTLLLAAGILIQYAVARLMMATKAPKPAKTPLSVAPASAAKAKSLAPEREAA